MLNPENQRSWRAIHTSYTMPQRQPSKPYYPLWEGQAVPVSTTVSFPSTQRILHNYVETGTASPSDMTIGKWRAVKKMMDSKEVPEEGRYIAFTSTQLQSLLRTTEITSRDYNEVQALVDGRINRFLGFQVVRTERLSNNADGYRRCMAWQRDGLLLAMGKDIKTMVSDRPDKRYSTQVYVCMSIGAVRMEEERVIEILCDESA